MTSSTITFPEHLLPKSGLLPSLAATIDEICERSVAQKLPFLIQTLGVPGVGKSSLVLELQHHHTNNSAVVIGFDRLMETIPEYQLAVKHDRAQAFTNFELPARSGSYLLAQRLMDKRANIIFDHGGGFDEHLGMLDYARQKKYVIAIAYVSAPASDAKARILTREQIEGRHTPLAYVDERQGIINSLLPEYVRRSDLFMHIDNPQSPDQRNIAILRQCAMTMSGRINSLCNG